MTNHSMEDNERTRVSQHLEALEKRLISEYGTDPGRTEDDVARLFDEVTARFDDAAVTAFLPILIERRVRKSLHRRTDVAA